MADTQTERPCPGTGPGPGLCFAEGGKSETKGAVGKHEKLDWTDTQKTEREKKKLSSLLD